MVDVNNRFKCVDQVSPLTRFDYHCLSPLCLTAHTSAGSLCQQLVDADEMIADWHCAPCKGCTTWWLALTLREWGKETEQTLTDAAH